MKFKSKIKMFEEFETTTNSNTTTTAEAPATVAKPQSKSGEAIRTEVLADVDSILTNLETLSAQITEEILQDIDYLLENTDWSNAPLNESFMEEMMKTFKSMKSFAILNGSWKSLYANKLKVELANIDKEAAFVLKGEKLKEKALEAVKAKFDAKVAKIRAQEGIPSEKKSQEVKALRTQQDEAMKDGGAVSKKIDGKINAQLTQLQETGKAALRDAGQKVTDLESNNTIESELLKKQWLATKQKTQDELDNKHIMDKYETKAKYDESDDPELAEKKAKAAKELQAKQDKEAQEAQKERVDALKEAQAEAEARAAEGDEAAQEANKRISEFYKTSTELIGSLQSVKPEDYDDARKLEIKKLKKAQSEAEKKVSGQTFIDGGVAKDKNEGDSIKTEMVDTVDNALKDFKGLLDTFDNIKSDTEKAIEAAQDAQDDAKTALDLVQADDVEGKKAAQKTYFEAQIATQNAKKADAEANNEDSTKFDTKIAELQQKITDLDGGGGTTEKTSQQLADEFIADNEGFKVITDKGAEVTVRNADTGEDEQKPKYEGEKDFTGKKEDGTDDDVVTVGKEIPYSETASVNVPAGKPLTEGMTVAEKFAILMNK